MGCAGIGAWVRAGPSKNSGRSLRVHKTKAARISRSGLPGNASQKRHPPTGRSSVCAVVIAFRGSQYPLDGGIRAVGCGTSSSAPMAKKNVKKSIKMIPRRPMATNKKPAATGVSSDFQGLSQAAQSRGARQVFLGHQHGDGGGVGRLLEGA